MKVCLTVLIALSGFAVSYEIPKGVSTLSKLDDAKAKARVAARPLALLVADKQQPET